MPSASFITRERRDARLGLLEVAHREAADVPLHLPAHLGDRALGGLAEHLGEGEGGDRLDERRRARRQHELHEELPGSPCR